MRMLSLFLACALLCIAACSFHEGPTVSIASWNLQVFGDAKAGNPALMELYAEKIQDYDLVFVQEIRDADGSAWVALCARLVNYTCTNSTRAGRSSSKEQYGIAYKESVQLVDLIDYNIRTDDFERPPIEARFAIDGTNLTVFAIHIKPDDAQEALLALERLVRDQTEGTENVIVLGDLNADCRYYDERARAAFGSWHFAIGDDEDTTSGASDCTYDRILLNDGARDLLVRSGIDDRGITPDVSDHYLVWARLTRTGTTTRVLRGR